MLFKVKPLSDVLPWPPKKWGCTPPSQSRESLSQMTSLWLCQLWCGLGA